MNHPAKIAAGVLAGLAAGVVLGILFAPSKGSETRRKIIKEGKDLADALTDRITDMKTACCECEKKETA